MGSAETPGSVWASGNSIDKNGIVLHVDKESGGLPRFPSFSFSSSTLSTVTMIDTISVVCLALVVLATVLFLARGSSSKDDGKPKLLKLPIIGDLHSSPIEKPLQKWDAWAKEKGAIATPKLFGLVPIVVINTSEAATELLSKRSAWYSNRPSSVSVEMITGAEPGQSKFTLMHDMDDVSLYGTHNIEYTLIIAASPSSPPYTSTQSGPHCCA